jgi:hypothetical protein
MLGLTPPQQDRRIMTISKLSHQFCRLLHNNDDPQRGAKRERPDGATIRLSGWLATCYSYDDHSQFVVR